jgi:hypothetical protein
LPDNGVLIKEKQWNSEHDQGFVKACDVKPDDADVMDKAVRIVGHLQIFTDIHLYLVYAEEESRFGCIGGMEAYKLLTVIGHGRHSR